MKRLVIYHGPNCTDGFTAAWVFWKVYGETADYFPQIHEPGNSHRPPSLAGYDHVVVVDFAYPREVLLRMHQEMSGNLIVLDHHQTAQADLEGLDFCTFDMNRSGAGIAWDRVFLEPHYLRAPVARPKLVDYVEDRDLWRLALPDSKEINAYIGAVPKGDFARWDDLAKEIENEHCAGIVVMKGRAILAAKDTYVEQIAAQARRMLVPTGQVVETRIEHAPGCSELLRDHETHDVFVVNCPYFLAPDVAGELAKRDVPFAVAWFQKADGTYYYSLRSRGGFDVSQIAKAFGGGGHPAAAGFVHPRPPDELFFRKDTR